MRIVFKQLISGAMFGSLALAGLFLVTPTQVRASIIPGLCSLTIGTGGQDCFVGTGSGGGVYDEATGTFYGEGQPGVQESIAAAQASAYGGTFIPGAQLCDGTQVGNCTVTNGSTYLYNYVLGIAPGEYIDSGEPSILDVIDIGGYVAGSAAADSAAAGLGVAGVADGTLPLPYLPFLIPTAPGTGAFSVTDVLNSQSNPNGILTGAEFNDGIAFESTLGPDQLQKLQNVGEWQAVSSNTNTPDSGYAPLELPSALPEPTTMALMGSALLGLGLIRRRALKK